MQPVCDIWRYDAPAMDTNNTSQLEFREWLGDQMDRIGVLDQTEFAKLVGVAQSSISDWLRGEGLPRKGSREKIARALGISLEEINRVIKHTERPAGVELAARLEFGVGVRASVAAGKDPVDMTYLPISDTAAADTLRASWGPGDLYPVPRQKLQGLSSPVLLVAKGDCMEPRGINDGDLVLLDSDVQPREGDVVAVRMGDEITLKEYRLEDDEVVLRAAKPGYPPIRIKQSDQGAHLIGVVKGSSGWKNH